MRTPRPLRFTIVFLLIGLILFIAYYYRTDYFTHILTALTFSFYLSLSGLFMLGAFYSYFERAIREHPKRAKTINHSLILIFVALFIASSGFVKLLTWLPTIVCLAFGFILAFDITFSSLFVYGFLAARRQGKTVGEEIAALRNLALLSLIAIVITAAVLSFTFYLNDLPWALVIPWQVVVFWCVKKSSLGGQMMKPISSWII